MNLRALWYRITTTRYTRSLEREIVRLRAENRALLNSILGIAGVPPVPVEDVHEELVGFTVVEGLPGIDDRSGVGSRTKLRRGNGSGGSGLTGSGHSALPLRKRSWQQINRALELESARRKAEA